MCPLLTLFGAHNIFRYSRNSPHFTEPEGSLPHSQPSATQRVILSCNSEYKEMQYVSCIHFGSVFFFIPKLNVFSKILRSKMSTLFSWITSTQWHFLFLWPILKNKTFNTIIHNKETYFSIPNTGRVSLFSPMCTLTGAHPLPSQ